MWWLKYIPACTGVHMLSFSSKAFTNIVAARRYIGWVI